MNFETETKCQVREISSEEKYMIYTKLSEQFIYTSWILVVMGLNKIFPNDFDDIYTRHLFEMSDLRDCSQIMLSHVDLTWAPLQKSCYISQIFG